MTIAPDNPIPPLLAGGIVVAITMTAPARFEAALNRHLPRHGPALAGFVKARFSLRRFNGLPLTVLVASGAAMILLFNEITEEVIESGEMLRIDTAVLDLMAPLRTPVVVAVFAWLTAAGDNMTLAAVAAVASALLWAHGRPRLILGLWVVVAGSQAMLWIAEFAIDRTRPEFVTEVTALSPSFPSGHATGATAIHGFIAYAVSRAVPRGQRFEVGFWAAAFIVLVGLSRVMQHVHYPSDVLGGFLAGTLWLAIGVAVAEWARETASRR